MSDREALARAIVERGAIRYTPGSAQFELRSGALSDFYADLSVPLMYPADREAIRERVRAELWDLPPALYLCGVALGGALVAHTLGFPTLIARRSQGKRLMEPEIEPPSARENRRIIVIDDVATSGNSVVYACDVAYRRGWVVVGAIVVVDREEGAREAIEKWGRTFGEPGFEFRAVLTRADLIRALAGESPVDTER